ACWCSTPAPPRCRGRSSTTRGRRSAATGMSMSSTCSTGCARRCWAPLEPGSTVVTLSSGAALRGSPLSGGYAGAKAAIRWLTAYAAQESAREGLGIRFVSLLPQLTPATELGAVFAAAYGTQGPALTPERVRQAVIERIAR